MWKALKSTAAAEPPARKIGGFDIALSAEIQYNHSTYFWPFWPAREISCMKKGAGLMYTQEITVKNEVGLHARPATYFIQKANEFKSGIWVEKEERRVNAKSLLGVLSLGIVKGTTITLIADGVDEKEAVDALTSLIESNFGE